MAWTQALVDLFDQKMRRGIELAQRHEDVPYHMGNGDWACQPLHSWVSGFWPATAFMMYRETGWPGYRYEAIRVEEKMDAAFAAFERLSHDVGFMWLPVSGVRYAQEGNADSLRRLKLAGWLLAGRFNPNGFIRAWEGEGKEGWAIIDCMMNLPLLYTMTELTGDPRFALIGKTHATTAAKHFVRADGSCRHIVCFDPATGAFRSAPAGQGYAEESCWTRGASWAIYGFALSYAYTGEPLFLETAQRVAEHFLAHLPENGVAPIDFMQPAEPAHVDESASAIAADGLLELARLMDRTNPDKAAHYRQSAERILHSLWQRADKDPAFPALLTNCASKYHGGSIGITMTYADLFFVEAVRKLRGADDLMWMPLGRKEN